MGHFEEFLAFEGKVDGAVGVLAIAVNVEAVHGAVPVEEGLIFF